MAQHIEITPLLDQTPPNEASKNESPARPRLLKPSPTAATSFFAFAVASHQVIQEGGKADYIIEIRTADQTNESTNQVFDEGSSTIFKVNVGLCESNPDAYIPKLISIGPYHKKNPRLRSMEKYKLRYQQRFLQRKAWRDVEYYISEMEKLKDEALKCYDDIGDLESDIISKFSDLLLLDGCFVVEYIREFYEGVPEGEDKIIDAAWMESLVDRDLLLLENQLPFFILAKLHEMTKDPTDAPFIQMVKYNFGSSLPKVTPKFINATDDDDAEEIKHLLQVVHMCCCPSEMNTGLTRNSRKKKGSSKKSCNWNPLRIGKSKKKFKTKDGDLWHDRMRSATELDEAGIRFSNVGKIYRKLNKNNKEDAISLFDIKFNNGLLEIPCFEVVNSTETILRNLIAYEQHSSDVHPKYFTDYVIFMDHLINSGKDVNLLRLNGIIRNRIGDDEEVAIMFNKLGEGVIPSTDFFYKVECRKVIEHCEKPWNENMASLRHNYLNSPWAKISTAAAIILLLLTVAQTVLALISTLK
ncbi:UPF0481 protein At3g47200-like isoform X2 [Nicotiana sylvestris]|nr:PREDICTED: UPF0481 protein At3g47200-like isoform X2 [Nicotiana sylvestris]